ARKVFSTGVWPTIYQWHTSTGNEVERFKPEMIDESWPYSGNTITPLTLSPDGKHLALRSFGPGILWEFTKSKKGIRLPNNLTSTSHSFSPDGAVLAFLGNRGVEELNVITLWDVARGKELRCLKGHENEIIALSFSPDGKVLATGSKVTDEDDRPTSVL